MPIGSGGRAPVAGWVVRGRVRRGPERSLGRGVGGWPERALGGGRRGLERALGRGRGGPEGSRGGIRGVLERPGGRCGGCGGGRGVRRPWGGSPAGRGYRTLPNRHRGSSLTASPVAGQLGGDPACLEAATAGDGGAC